MFISRLFNFLFKNFNVFCSLHLDNSLLLQPFCTKAQFLNGKAKQDMTEKLAGKVMFHFACLFVCVPSELGKFIVGWWWLCIFPSVTVDCGH